MYKNIINTILMAGLLLMLGCVERFQFPAMEGETNILVVNGYLDVNNKECNVRLTNALNLGDPGKPVPILNAAVTLESDQNEVFYLSSRDSGHYSIDNIPVELGRKYRLSVRTEDGNRYQSEYTTVLSTPPIDSVTWRVQDGNVLFEVSSHDPLNNTRYYLWEVEETWQYASGIPSSYEIENGQAKRREQQTHLCWKTNKASSIFIGTSERLSEDVISKHPLIARPGNSQQMGLKYSLLVGQYAISREEFEYWQMLKKNTENVGSLFDAQPSQVKGNFESVNDPGIPVLGFFGARTRTEKRIFVDWKELVAWNFMWNPRSCELDTIEAAKLYELGPNLYDLIDYLFLEDAYIYTNRYCSDCRVQGGINIKPDFWE